MVERAEVGMDDGAAEGGAECCRAAKLHTFHDVAKLKRLQNQ